MDKDVGQRGNGTEGHGTGVDRRDRSEMATSVFAWVVGQIPAWLNEPGWALGGVIG